MTRLPYRRDVPISEPVGAVLDHYGRHFRGTWDLVRSAVVVGRPYLSAAVETFAPNGHRRQVYFPEDPGVSALEVGAILHYQLPGYVFRVRDRAGESSGHRGKEITVRLPEIVLDRISQLAFVEGRTLYGQLSVMVDRAFRERAAELACMRGPSREIPVTVSREAFERLHERSSAIGARPVAEATSRLVRNMFGEAVT